MAIAGADSAFLPGTKKNKPIDIVRFLKRNIVLIIVIGNFGFTLLAPFAFMGIKPFYKASAKLKIEPVVQSITGKDEETSILGQYKDFIMTQANRIRDATIIEKAIKKLTPEQKDALFPKGLAAEKCARLLAKRLFVAPISRTYLIGLAIQGDSPDGLAPVLNEIMDVYKETVDSEKRAQNDTRLAYLNSERDKLQQQIIAKRTKLRELAKLTNTSSFDEQFNFYFKQAEQLQKAYVGLYLKMVDAKHLYLRRSKEKIEISKLSMEPHLEEMVANDWGLDSTQSWTYQQLQGMRSSLDGLTEKNPERKHTEDRMKSMRKYELDMTEEVRELGRKVIYGKREYDLEKKLVEAKSKYDSIKTSMEDISLKLEAAKKEAGINSERLIIGEQIQAELGQMRQLLFSYENRINVLMVQTNVASRISIYTKAREPESPSGSNAKKLFMVCLVLPFGIVTFILLVIEFMDNRITSPRNIVSALGYPSSWPISRAPEGIPFSRVTLDARESVTSKALRSLALRIHRDAARNDSKLFLFNGVDNKSGVTEIILNTAHHLGQMLPSVLVIEATSSHPTLRKLLDLPPEHPGFSEVLTGKATFEEAIYTDFERNVNFIFSSPPPYTIESSLVFESILAEARKHFDIVLIDSTQIMRSDFTEYLAMHSDVVIMVIQGDRTLYRSVREIAQLFIRLEVPALAPVLNWGGVKYTTKMEKFLEKPYLKFILNRLNDRSSINRL